jgi:hypothetical protein
VQVTTPISTPIPTAPAHVPTVVKLSTPIRPPAQSTLFTPLPVPAASAPPALFPVSTLTPRPTPPSGFGTVSAFSPVTGRVFEQEKEEEEAVESAQAFAAYHPTQPNLILSGGSVLLVILLAAGSGAVLRRRGPRGAPALARADLRPSERYRRRRY